jgi:hypothetical protein
LTRAPEAVRPTRPHDRPHLERSPSQRPQARQSSLEDAEVLGIGGRGLSTVDVAAPPPAERLRPQFPLELRKRPDWLAVRPDVGLDADRGRAWLGPEPSARPLPAGGCGAGHPTSVGRLRRARDRKLIRRCGGLQHATSGTTQQTHAGPDTEQLVADLLRRPGACLGRSYVAVRCLIPLVTRGISDVRGVGFWLREGEWDHRLDELEGSTLGGGWAGQLLDVHPGRVGEDDVVAGEGGQVGKQGVEAVGWGAVVELVL